MDSEFIKIKVAAEKLGVSPKTIQRMIHNNRLEGVGFGPGGRKCYVLRSSLSKLGVSEEDE